LKICVYEDNRFPQFFPLTYLRPVFCLRAGIVPLFRRVERLLGSSDICLICRDQIAPLVAERHPDFPVNIIKRGQGEDVLFVNGRLSAPGNLPALIQEALVTTRFVSGD